MLPDRDRLRRRATQPRLVALHRALGRLRSTVTVMNTGAHPDDEHNDMLATLRHQHGARIIVACSTRGEGGQNTLGPERLGPLGVLRSREMEEAARVIDADIAWLGHGPDDPVHDFGFSKSGPDTLGRWGEDRTIDRLVRAYRQFRPDIVIPTFLDVPGQHGHHRAMTDAAERALALAADPAYITEGFSPWRVAKYYLPAWSGGGDTYDDELPPPPATTTITANGPDAATGMSFDRLGEVSRAYHASQNMGFWRHPPHTSWQLHLVGGATETSIFDQLPTRLTDLGGTPALAEADAAIEAAIAAFPDADKLITALLTARRAILAATPGIAPEHAHRLTRKLREIDAVLALAAGIDISAALSAASLIPGASIDLIIEADPGRASALTITPRAHPAITAPAAASLDTGRTELTISASPEAPIGNPFHPDWHSLGGNGLLSLEVTAIVAGETISFALDTEEPLVIDPAHAVSISPDALIIPTGTTAPQTIAIKGASPRSLALPALPGLAIGTTDAGLTLTPSADLAPGRHSLPISVNGQPAYAVTPIAYPHIGRTRFVRPQTLDILALDLTLPKTRIGYIGGGADNVGLWLERLGVDVTPLGPDALSGDLTPYDTIVVGLFAFGTRPDLAAAIAKLHEFVRAGGHLVTLYHRPGDNWRPDVTPPLPLTIGSPSLRWRVTNPAAPVTLLDPEHPLFTGPNRITTADFDGWDKERGLYFASSWDSAYTPLLSMSDAGESPLTGSLLSAKIGEGRHTHTSLVLHHQMDKVVPGAFRLMANLLQAA
ncbi:MAG: PIG-L family deacetylase [Devosia sp.]|uniref:PIG-L family deacetylase n=1 Tax=Devosia sp. TaxID=1871048 RepID=UPI0019EBC096|nr:PIG-L family deacetylase [Devosia sp.]MBF0677786.1 PIG-L family deacetylase [Devosia sp.]